MKYFRLLIKQECKARPQDESYNVWKAVDKKFSTIEEVREALEERYSKIPFNKGNEIYYDGKDGEAVHAGYTYSYWEDLYDRSNPGKKYYATDWIEVFEIDQRPAIEQLIQDKEEAA